ncbi:MAG: hypothetical protein ACOCWR_05110 [Oceanidesulfovibrio sp.]
MSTLLHIFRNTPFCRETLLHSLNFCESFGLDIIANLCTKIALGKIGSRVRAILKAARFPVLIPSSVFTQ